jgi:signal transduction histidine kinase
VRRRITEAIVGVAALILLALGVPLAIVVHRLILDSEVVELQAVAARTLGEIQVPIDAAQLARIPGEPDAPPPFTVYDAAGHRVFGDGPPSADPTTARALGGETLSATNGHIVVATPLIDDATEKVVGALRLSESLAGADHRSRIAWLIMGGSAAGALAVGWLVANRLARRLARPVSDLAARASRLGDGGPLEPALVSGIGEIDTLAGALANSVQRVNDALARERRFSADVSHQLRTPLTGLRLRLEAAQEAEAEDAGDSMTLDGALDDLNRIEQIVEHLLAFARDEMPPTSTVRLDVAAHEAVNRWADRAEAEGRPISLGPGEPLTAQGSSGSVAQILDVLIDNALQHGHGEIAISHRRLPGGAALDVVDRGMAFVGTTSERIFRRGEGAGTGIGLALARSLAESDGGRLVLSHQHPTTFSLILLADQDPDDPWAN